MGLFFGFDGRIDRRTWWFATLAMMVVVYSVVFGVSSAVPEVPIAEEGDASLLPFVGVVGLLVVLTWISFALSAKRFHDVDMSGWCVLLTFIPVVGGLVIVVMNGFIAGTPGANRYGPPPRSKSDALLVE